MLNASTRIFTIGIRPISILLVLSKIFEKVAANQVASAIESMHIYYNTISGFCKGFSTGHAPLKIRDDIRKTMKFGEHSLLVCLDF